MGNVEEPMLSRLQRLDNILKQLEDIRGTKYNNNNNNSPKSSLSCPSTPSRSSDDGQASPVDFPSSPKSLEKHCRPIDDVIMEAERKGTLLQRLMHVENRVLKICVEMEEEEEDSGAQKMRTVSSATLPLEKKNQRKGLKQLVRACVPAKP